VEVESDVVIVAASIIGMSMVYDCQICRSAVNRHILPAQVYEKPKKPRDLICDHRYHRDIGRKELLYIVSIYPNRGGVSE
jgi:hypothetical protein